VISPLLANIYLHYALDLWAAPEKACRLGRGDRGGERRLARVESGMTDDERELAIEAYSKIAEQITKEDGLINQRLTWGATINGALLALLGVGGGLFKDFLQHASTYVTIFVCVIVVFLAIIAALVCGSTIKGIVDARTQIRYLRHIYERKWQTKIEDELGLPRPFLDKIKVEKDKELGPYPVVSWWGDSLFRPFGLDGKTLGMDRWWGDNLFRFMIGLWVFAIFACLVVAAYHIAVP
jgi:hypothetical protein